MLRVSRRIYLSDPGAGNERTTMGNVAVVTELAGVDELEELFDLDASESAPEDDEEDDEFDEDEEDGEDGEEIKPEEIPHG
jgi:hypothetical protein